ncbi:MAG TPA: sigma-70 family RNA polymerase sigma factor [Syntrophomonas sp.]|nr:sigma-70 family RNA polymerase sigma factor [Syntrophomonas sp.]
MLSDEKLALQILSGDMAAFEELMNRYKRSIFTIAYRMMGNYHEAEDISQEVFVTVYNKLYQYDSTKKFGPWIHRIAVNTCISTLRKRNRVVSISFDETYVPANELDLHDLYEDPQVLIEQQELQAEIEEALLELPESYRMVLILRYQLDLKNQEIAEIIGVSRENVDVKIHRARKALRKILLQRWHEGGLKNELPAL